MKEFKIRIFQPIVPEYRVALFDGIAARYEDRVDIHASHMMGDDVSVPLMRMNYDYSHTLKRIGSVLWQVGFNLRGLSRGDVIVVCGDIHQFSSIWIALKAKWRGVRVVWWGHHKTATSKNANVQIRLFIARICSDVMLTYTRTGVNYLLSQGFRTGRVFATGNTIDQGPIEQAVQHWPNDRLSAWQVEHGIEGKTVLLCCSVLREKVHLDMIIRALAGNVLSKSTVLVVIGDGPMRREYEKLARRLRVEDRIIWVGATRDQEVMAPWFLSAKLFVYPGPVGLSILHAFSYGLPAVVHDNPSHQMPEFEVMEDGRTGYLFKEGDDLSLAKVISLALSDLSQLKKMSKYAKCVAHEKYSMEAMVANFCEALEVAAT